MVKQLTKKYSKHCRFTLYLIELYLEEEKKRIHIDKKIVKKIYNSDQGRIFIRPCSDLIPQPNPPPPEVKWLLPFLNN